MTRRRAGFATARDLFRVGLAARNFGKGRVVLCTIIASIGLQGNNYNSVKRIAASLGGKFFFVFLYASYVM